ncbi:MAG: Holliday junction resolvase RuvX [Parachlamydiales bacterium]|nr:Holliday junction resolvase RuvX [Parachlamydiales bacterium]
MRIIAIDYGKVRIGIAITDMNKTIAYPLKTIKASDTLEKTADIILNEVNAYFNEIETIVIGLPLHLNNTESQMSKEVKKLEEIIKSKAKNIKIVLKDERLTSLMAERDLKDTFKMNRKKRSKNVDTLSACIILQNFLDTL